ncbi:hypothetical protein [Fulvivirga lutimaris]|uniref:hypothetical protein n=1 Tax=Fulvivirga lutimaris TaxID=1819566 RepID=UPI0012BCBE2E|nr:hypothetical protein [Fulvivirga lutimaris]MTI41997.1 hypothetical protein [Fulvivirga lutimaris]
MKLFFDIIFYTSFITAGLAVVLGLKLLKEKVINLFVILVTISFFADVLNASSSYYYLKKGIDLGIRNVGDVYRILELILLTLFFQSFDYKKIIKITLITFVGLSILYFVIIYQQFFQIDQDSTPMRLSSAFVSITFGLLFYKSVITKMDVPLITSWPPFYFVTSVFIYFCGVVIAFLLYYPLFKIDKETGLYLWSFHNAWLIIRNILLIIGFYYTYKTKYKWSPISIL